MPMRHVAVVLAKALCTKSSCLVRELVLSLAPSLSIPTNSAFSRSKLYHSAGRNQPGESKSRLFMNTSASSTNYSNDNYSTALNEHMLGTCSNAKSAGVIVMTVALDLSSSDSGQAAQIAALRSCSSDSRFRKDSSNQPAKLFWNAKGGDLSTVFDEIADELSNLRIVG